MGKKEAIIVLIVVAAVVGGGLYWILKAEPFRQTENTIYYVLEKVRHMDSPPDKMELVEKDGWGRCLTFTFRHSAKALIYTVSSKGPDGIEGTDDDISRDYVDYNVARHAGQWTAEKAREFLNGVKDGLEKKSKYE